MFVFMLNDFRFIVKHRNLTHAVVWCIFVFVKPCTLNVLHIFVFRDQSLIVESRNRCWCLFLCAGGGESSAALHDPDASGHSGLCSVPLVGLQRQEIPGGTGTPVRSAAGGTHTYVQCSTPHILYILQKTRNNLEHMNTLLSNLCLIYTFSRSIFAFHRLSVLV